MRTLSEAAPAPPPPARPAVGDEPRIRPPHDLMGVFRVPEQEAESARRLGTPADLLAHYVPRCQAGSRLSRSAAYYRPWECLRDVTALVTALRTLDREPGEAPHLRRALIENLHNLYAAAAYGLWEWLTDHPRAATDQEALLNSTLDTAVRLSGALAGPSPADWSDTDFPDLRGLQRLRGLRVFRELDSQEKIHNELDFIVHHVLDRRPEITVLLVPLYGAIALGLAARAALPVLRPGRPLAVHFVRLGFHDLAGTRFLAADGSIRVRATGPAARREELAADVAGAQVLVLDDNVGYGTTLRAARTLVGQLRGEAVTRSVETAWHLYERSGLHDVSDAADLPSLRPNLHHGIQSRLIGKLSAADVAGYVGDPAHDVGGTLQQQMRANYELALGLGSWSATQLTAMHCELSRASLGWREPAVPIGGPPHR